MAYGFRHTPWDVSGDDAHPRRMDARPSPIRHSLSVRAESPTNQASSAAAEWATIDPRVTENGNSGTAAWNDLVRDEVGRLLPNTAKVRASLGGGRQRSVHLHHARASIDFFCHLAAAVRDAANQSI